MKKLLAVVSVMLFALGLSACNTIKGVGEDVERGGEKMQGAAEKRGAQ